MKASELLKFILIGFSFLGYQEVLSQADSLSGTDLINHLLVEEQVEAAYNALRKQTDAHVKNNQADSLYQYPYFVGKIALLRSDTKSAIQTVEAFMAQIEKTVPKSKIHYETYTNLADFYDEIGEHEIAMTKGKRALDQILLSEDAKGEDIGLVRYNIGISAYSLDHLNEAKEYFLAAVYDYENSPSTKKEVLADGYNAMGAITWTFNQLDSAQYYYEKAVRSVEISDADEVLKLYLATVFRTNIALLQESKGNVFNAIEIQKGIIEDCKTVLAGMQDEMLRQRTYRTESHAISNLGAMYHDLGYIERAKDLLLLAYQKKKEIYEASDVRLVNNLIQIAQAEYSLKDFDQSLLTTEQALKQLATNSGEYIAKKAEILALKAEIVHAMGDMDMAKELYVESNLLFKGFYKTDFSRVYLIFLRKYALFLADIGAFDEAKKMGMLAYNYAQKNAGKDSFLLFNHQLSLAEISYKAKDFKSTAKWAKLGIALLNERLKSSNSSLDSLQIEFNKPRAILLGAKARYLQAAPSDTMMIKSLLEELTTAVNILERRKTTVFNNEEILALLSDYSGINDFTKKLNAELFWLSGKETYLNATISVHESGIYNRIRTKFNLRNNLGFSKIPQSIIERENGLKRKMSLVLANAEEGDIDSFFSLNKQWDGFLDSLRQNHSAYYRMRYGAIEVPLKELSKKIPANTTMVRYFFIDDALFAFVIDGTQKVLIPLEIDRLDENIAVLNDYGATLEQLSDASYLLYNQLWQPIIKKVKTKNVIIFPDRDLFNLSFEMLTSKKIKTLKDYTTHSLLADHVISYNYSLSFLGRPEQAQYKNDLVAFVPEFTRSMKDDYVMVITDSSTLDKTYLNLISQPFSADLAQELGNRYEATAYLNKNASKRVFTQNAKEHKIIHIGTHAQSNNVSPELSRLIFAKNAASESALEDNSLYSYEIYNYDLSSNLAVLTACETGRPSYQAGEGMISLAHAFNYAGSQSILTSLWKIDEESSTEILSNFYNYLSEGLAKDEALRQAKLDYLSTAEGRTIHPQFWAGLVLMGDNAPIALDEQNQKIYWLILFLAVISLALFAYQKFKKS